MFLFHPDGSSYQGQVSMVTGRAEGLGKRVKSNGEVHEGYWKDGRPDKVGRLINADGTVLHGE